MFTGLSTPDTASAVRRERFRCLALLAKIFLMHPRILFAFLPWGYIHCSWSAVVHQDHKVTSKAALQLVSPHYVLMSFPLLSCMKFPFCPVLQSETDFCEWQYNHLVSVTPPSFVWSDLPPYPSWRWGDICFLLPVSGISRSHHDYSRVTESGLTKTWTTSLCPCGYNPSGPTHAHTYCLGAS